MSNPDFVKSGENKSLSAIKQIITNLIHMMHLKLLFFFWNYSENADKLTFIF